MTKILKLPKECGYHRVLKHDDLLVLHDVTLYKKAVYDELSELKEQQLQEYEAHKLELVEKCQTQLQERMSEITLYVEEQLQQSLGGLTNELYQIIQTIFDKVGFNQVEQCNLTKIIENELSTKLLTSELTIYCNPDLEQKIHDCLVKLDKKYKLLHDSNLSEHECKVCAGFYSMYFDVSDLYDELMKFFEVKCDA